MVSIICTRNSPPVELTDVIYDAHSVSYFFFNDTATTEIYTLSLHDALPISGQMSRVYSAKIAGIKAADENLDPAGAVMASDAFFPFRVGIDSAAAAGISAVIEPGGSIRDDEVIAAADEHGLAMVFTGMRHFRH